MRVRVDEIPESGRFIHYHLTRERFNELFTGEEQPPFTLESPLNVDLEIIRHPDHIRVEGTLRAGLDMTCGRCLTRYPWVLDEKVEVFLFEKVSAPHEEEVELEDEELDYEFFDGEVIDVDQLVAEQIFLAVPLKSLCTEDCKGICSRCGANLNEGECECGDQSGNNPFTVLADLKRKLPE